jgi:hypothetical protein
MVRLAYLWLEFGYLLYHSSMARRAVEHLIARRWAELSQDDHERLPPTHVLNRPLPYRNLLVTAFCQTFSYPRFVTLSGRSPVRAHLNAMVLGMNAFLLGLCKSLIFVLPAILMRQTFSSDWARVLAYVVISSLPCVMIAATYVQFFRAAGQRSIATPITLVGLLCSHWALWLMWRSLGEQSMIGAPQ